MIAEELINQMIPSLKPSDTAERALRWMEELHITQLPVVEEYNYMGLVSEEIIFQGDNLQGLVADMELLAPSLFVTGGQHFYDLIKIAADHRLQVVAVVDEDKKFIGAITVNDTLMAFARSSAMQEPGGIIVLNLEERDYSLAEISRLIESNDIKVLSSYVDPDPFEPGRIRLTLKLNREDITRVVATLERFDYSIIAKYQHTESKDNDRERLDLLLRYLDM